MLQTLIQWQEEAIVLDHQSRDFQQVHHTTNMTTSHAPANDHTPSTSQVIPMDVDGTVPRKKAIICFNCRKEGHIARQCLEPKKPRVRTIHEEVRSIGNAEFLEMMKEEMKMRNILQDFASDSQ